MHKVRVRVRRAELERAHQGWEAAVGEGVEDKGNGGWREWLVQDKEGQLCCLRFEYLGSIGEQGKRIGRIFHGGVGGRWGLKSRLEAVEEGLEV